jgi:predicted 2-oxoglutarate/Fe(II)-dependent dioxygenase YbiX/peroxiredoxin
MSTPAFRLAIGDRAPNFTLPDQSGKLRMFYEETRGLPILLYVLGPPAPLAREGLAQLARRRVELTAQAHIMALIAADPGESRAIARGLDLKFPLLTDAAGRVGAAYCHAAGLPAGPALFVLDPNQRLLDILLPSTQGDLAGEALASLAPFGARAAPVLHRRIAPALIVPDIIDQDLSARLIDIWETQGHEEGAVLSTASGVAADRINHGSKKRLDHKVKDPELARELTLLLGPRLATETFRAFQFEQFRLEPFFIVCYDAARGDFFRPHRDNLIPELAGRRFAVTINLNDDYEGGGLRFPEYGGDHYRPPAGGAILFSCSLLHEALPPTRGRRFALLSFLRVREEQTAPLTAPGRRSA